MMLSVTTALQIPLLLKQIATLCINPTVTSRPSRPARDPGLHGGGDDPAGTDGDAHLRLARRKPPRGDRLVQERRRRRLLIHHFWQGWKKQNNAKICKKPYNISNTGRQEELYTKVANQNLAGMCLVASLSPLACFQFQNIQLASSMYG